MLIIDHTWDGRPALPGEAVTLDLALGEDGLSIVVDAPLHDDPAPEQPPGPTWALWEHEVVELFVLGEGERYTEVELGPWGHHLVLRLEGRRNPVDKLLPIDVTVERSGGRWRASTILPRRLLPPGVLRCNATAAHGPPEARRYLSWQALPGDRPDFHRLGCFVPLLF